MPEFPKEFVTNHCPKVKEARYWAKHFKNEETEFEPYAECAFRPAGCGIECESCNLFLTRPMRTEAEFKFLKIIEQFYKDMSELHEKEEREKKDLLQNGSGI